MAPLEPTYGQLRRQFWVSKAQIAANKYDLSASRYRVQTQAGQFHEAPQTTLERLLKLDTVMREEMQALMMELEPGVLA